MRQTSSCLAKKLTKYPFMVRRFVKKMFDHAPKVHSVFGKCVKEANILPANSCHWSGALTVASAYSATGVFLLA